MPQRQQLKGDVTFHVLVQKHLFPNNGTAAANIDFSERCLPDSQVGEARDAPHAAHSN